MEKEKLAHELQVMVKHPTDHECKDTASNKMLLNFPITAHEINNANYMFGSKLSGVRGKTLRNKPSRVDTEEYVRITEYFYKLHKFVMLTYDVMFVNGNEFMITLATNLNFMTEVKHKISTVKV